MILMNVVLGLAAIMLGTKYFLHWETERKVNLFTIFRKRGVQRATYRTSEDIFDRELNAIRGTVLIIVWAVAFFVGLSR